ncbi:MAG: PAS domain-containing protein [Coriobacteriia bacterium]
MENNPDRTAYLLRNLIQTIPDPVWLKDTDGVYLACNIAHSRLIGASVAEIVGKTDYDFADSASADASRARDLQAIEADGPTSNREWVTFADDGHRTLLETIKTPMFDEAGDLIGILGIAREAIQIRAQESLRERERYLRALIDSFPFLVWLKDTEGHFLAVNQAFADSCDIGNPDYIVGKSDFDVWPSELAEAYTDDDRAVMESGRQKTVEEEIVEQGGREWFETFKTPVTSERGELLGTVGFARNISERKRAEEELVHRDALLQGLSRATDRIFAHEVLTSGDIAAALQELGTASNADRVYIFEHKPGPTGTRGFISQCYEWANNGVEPQIDNPDLQDVSWDDVAPRWYDTFVAGGHIEGNVSDFPDDERTALEPQGVVSLLALPIESNGRIWGFIGFDACRAERTWLPSEVDLLRTGANSIASAIARMRAEVALRASEARFRLLAENATDVVFTASNDGSPTWFSPSVTDVIGWLPEQLMGQPFTDFVHPDDLASIQSAQKSVLRGEPAKFEMRVRTTAGNYRWMSVTLRPVYDDEGVVIGRAGGWRDVQDEVEARDALAASQALLRATLDALLDPHVLLEPVRDETRRIVDFVYTDANDAACAYMDMDCERLLGSHLLGPMSALAGSELLDMCARTMESGQPLVVDDYSYLEGSTDPARRYDIRAVRVGDALSLTWHDVTKRHEIEYALRQRVEELAALQRISQLLAVSGDPRIMVDELSSEIGALLTAGDVHIYVLSDGAEAPDASPEAAAESLLAECVSELEAAVVRDALANGHLATAESSDGDTQHVLGLPMVAGSRTVGLLTVAGGPTSVSFSAGQMVLAATVADLLGTAIRNAQLHEIETRQVAVVERQRLARDLHDAVTQSIYSANLIAEALPAVWERSPEEGRHHLETLRRLVRAALAELRTLLYELRPASLRAASLEMLIERLGDALKGQNEIVVDITLPAELVLPDEVKLAFYRIAQESLSNIGKHSRAARATVSVTDDADVVQITVQDDGQGFELDQARPESFGLNIMRERAEDIGAALAIESAPRAGTTISAIWHRFGTDAM